jgi:3-oxoacyl-[acyl-carrier protein] reductase
MERFEGKVALVTGGARGIGAATVRRLSADGARVALSDLDLEPAEELASELQRSRSEALALSGDVSVRSDVKAMVDQTIEEFGRLDFLVTCAGITRDNLIHKMSDNDWDDVISTHLRGTFLCAQIAQEVMVNQKGGKMVFVSSTSALGNRGQANYSAAKAGIQGLARTLSLELGRYNVNVNAVAPGFVETRMTRSIAERTGGDWEEIKRIRAEAIPLQRIGQPEDIAGAIAFLCSEDASFITGQILYVRGGP